RLRARRHHTRDQDSVHHHDHLAGRGGDSGRAMRRQGVLGHHRRAQHGASEAREGRRGHQPQLGHGQRHGLLLPPHGIEDATGPKRTKYSSAGQVTELQAALTDARVAIETVQRRSEETLAGFRKAYPATLNFAYRTPAYAKPFYVSSIWHDGQSTFIKADARELPALYEVTARGTPSPVDFQC